MKVSAFLLIMLFLSHESKATICGDRDRRVDAAPASPAVGFLFRNTDKKDANLMGCTVTLISDSCAISAGHCGGRFHAGTGKVQFGISHLEKTEIGKALEYVYDVDHTRSVAIQHFDGPDFSVLKLKANAKTNLLPGRSIVPVKISSSVPKEGGSYYSYGYGFRSSNTEIDVTQKFRQGPVSYISSKFGIFFHQIDTQEMDSGSAILNEQGEIIGVQDVGLCDVDSVEGEGLKNVGTLVTAPEFSKAIQDCLR